MTSRSPELVFHNHRFMPKPTADMYKDIKSLVHTQQQGFYVPPPGPSALNRVLTAPFRLAWWVVRMIILVSIVTSVSLLPAVAVQAMFNHPGYAFAAFLVTEIWLGTAIIIMARKAVRA